MYSVIRSAYLPTHLVVTISGGFNALALLVAAAAGGLTPLFFSLPFLIFFSVRAEGVTGLVFLCTLSLRDNGRSRGRLLIPFNAL